MESASSTGVNQIKSQTTTILHQPRGDIGFDGSVRYNCGRARLLDKAEWNRTQHNFFDDDNGNSLVPLLRNETHVAPTQRRLSRAMSQLSLHTTSRASTSSNLIISAPTYVIELTLADLCNYIDNERSLQAAEIVSTECYRQPAGAVTHRFVVLELRRLGRNVEWLRLDRRRGEGVSILRFFALSGVTKANDRVRSPSLAFAQN